jgi:uncharacterized membrane protein YvbJ
MNFIKNFIKSKSKSKKIPVESQQAFRKYLHANRDIENDLFDDLEKEFDQAKQEFIESKKERNKA